MAPFKSSLSRSAGKLLGVFRERDISLRGYVQENRVSPELIYVTLTNSASNNTGGGNRYITWTSSGAFAISGPGLAVPTFKIDYLLVGGGGAAGGFGAGGGYFNGASGVDSTALGVRAGGGGKGSRYSGQAGGAGASGGGGGAPGGAAGVGNVYSPISPVQPAPAPGQGNSGGAGSPGVYGGSGGGGAGQAGEGSKPNSQSGYGGYGKAAFSGDTNFPTTYGTPGPSAGRWFAGGGGGAGGTPNPDGGAHNAPGGAGGGGNGRNNTPYAPSSGTANTGGGAGSINNLGGGGAGGAGAGGYLEATNQSISAATYPVVIGAGGLSDRSPQGGNGGSGIFVLKIPSGAQDGIVFVYS